MASLVWSGKNNRGLTRRDCAAGASGTSYLWTGAPYPLRWLSGGLYQLELRPMSSGGGEAPLLAKSPFFSISDQAKVSGSTTGSSGAPVGWFQHLSLASITTQTEANAPLRLRNRPPWSTLRVVAHRASASPSPSASAWPLECRPSRGQWSSCGVSGSGSARPWRSGG